MLTESSAFCALTIVCVSGSSALVADSSGSAFRLAIKPEIRWSSFAFSATSGTSTAVADCAEERAGAANCKTASMAVRKNKKGRGRKPNRIALPFCKRFSQKWRTAGEFQEYGIQGNQWQRNY